MGGFVGALVTRYAFLFPGQGSQYSGMGKALAEAYPESRAAFDQADAALEQPISRLCFEGPDSELALTENTQPCILTVSVAALRALEARGLSPVAAAGHSLGEYAAHVAAGTVRFDESVRCVRRRGRFMQDAVKVGDGAMAAILGLDVAGVEQACSVAAGDGIVSAANLNGPKQVVIAGHTAAVERAVVACREAGARRALILQVSAPFHCSLMEPAADRLSAVLETMEFRDPRVPVYTNSGAEAVTEGAQARRALVRQVASPVRWKELIEKMLDDGIETFVEVGPGKVLAGLVRGIQRTARVLPVGDPDQVEAAVAELATVSTGGGS